MTPPLMTVRPDRERFMAAYQAGEPQAVWIRAPDDIETPVSAVLKLGRDRGDVFLLESVEKNAHRGRYSIIGVDPDLIWRVRDGVVEQAAGADVAAKRFTPQDDAPIPALRRLLAGSALELPAELPAPAAGVFGYLSYEFVRHLERLPAPKADPIGVPEALLVRPSVVIVFDSIRQEVIFVTPARAQPGVDAEAAYEAARARLLAVQHALARPIDAGKPEGRAAEALERTAVIAPADFRTMVDRAKAHIRAGDVFQVVPAQRFTVPFPLPPFALYRALRRLNPSPFLFYLSFDEFAVVGSSPEILVRVHDGVMTLRPLAGTRPRGGDPAEDAAHEADLLADPKERAEHLMLLDLGRNDVGRVAKWGEVTVSESFAVERYSHVMHIVSNVHGPLRPECDAVDALLAGFPAGTVSGAPKVRAMEIIHDLEPERRGVYAGGVGYFSAGGDMDTCIALRTAVVKDGVMHVKAGGGVVFDSDPEAERQETLHKSNALLTAASQARWFV